MKKTTFAAILVLASFLAPRPALRAQTAANDTLAIIETVMNYGDGFYSGSAERMEKALCPDLYKLAPVKLPNLESFCLTQSTYTGLIEMARAKVALTDEAKRKISVKILQISGDLALARLSSAQFNDYLAMAKMDGSWKIVNVLWTFGPDSPNRPIVPLLNADEQKPAVEMAVRDFIEGLYSSDPTRVDRAIHPRFSQATLSKLPTTGKPMISRDGCDMILGYAKAKMAAQDPAKWNFQIRMIDYMDGLAVAELSNPTGPTFIQLFWTGTDWKIVTMLRKR